MQILRTWSTIQVSIERVEGQDWSTEKGDVPCRGYACKSIVC